MFDYLGKHVAERPRIFILVWVIFVVAGLTAALGGFGGGNIFQRLKSGESMVPGSDSDRVAQAQSAKTDGETLILITEHAKPGELRGELENFGKKVRALRTVASFSDPLTVDAAFWRNVEEQKRKAGEAAVNAAKPQIDAAVAQELGRHTEIAAIADPKAREAVKQQIASQTAAKAKEKILSEAEKQAAEKTASLKNPAAALRSHSGFATVIKMKTGHEAAQSKRLAALISDFKTCARKKNASVTVSALSPSLLRQTLMDRTATDLVRGEIVGLPVALVLLVIVFGGLLAAGLPLVSALSAIGLSMGAVWAVTFCANVDSFLLNIITIIGLALSIDYGLLVVSRFREEISGVSDSGTDFGSSPAHVTDKAIRRAVTETVRTAGRTVSFSALTIACSIAGLFVMKAPMLKMIALGGMLVTLFAVFTAVTLVPALICIFGKRLIRPSRLVRIRGIRVLFRILGDATGEYGMFSKLAAWVHRRPWKVLIAVAAVMFVAAMPIRDMAMRSNFTEYAPKDSEVHRALALTERDYPAFAIPTVSVFVPGPGRNAESFIRGLHGHEDVKRAEIGEKPQNGTIVNVYAKVSDPVGAKATKIVQDLRAQKSAVRFFVGGAAATQYDFIGSLKEGAPYAAGIIILAVFILLFLLTGSLAAPLKALMINIFSLVTSMGITVFIFRHGLFGVPRSDSLETFVVACAVAFGFGLAMDYEVFLLARIKEYWDLIGDNNTAVEKGLQRSGRIVTAAALTIIAVFIGFSFGDLLPIVQIGVALAVTVFVDASLVRMLLVPALMTLLGKWNWWAPGPLRKIYEKFRIVH